jgi:phosphopantetheine adenylyltransferase/dephospho-CoA kinase
MLVIGLTGGIGTGKSEVARILAELGAEVIHADQVGHEAYRPDSETWREVVSAFGSGILQPSGEIDRRKLGAIVFSDPSQLDKLNNIMHPRMARMVSEMIERLRCDGVSVVVVEAAVLLEAGWDSLVDEVWVTDSPAAVVVRRVQARNGLCEGEIRKRIESQMPAAERLSRATVVIDNSGDMETLKYSVKSLWEHRVARRVEQVRNG